ncbi:MAG TPA: hypothetical protein PLH15_10560 [Spirochaetota bacterium]|nr:hypothetical protein [Spirochaetota bacterium]HQQ24269.1 hypothetical protein [Spirochaetota bacterium]
MNLIRTIRENIQLMKGTSPIIEYKKEMRELLEKYSVDRSRESLDDIIKVFGLSKDPIKQKDINNALEIIQKAFEDVPLSITYSLLKHTENAWNYSRKPLKPVKIEKAFDETQIINIDTEVISKLVMADIVWIKNHASGTAMAKELSELMQEFKLQKLTMIEVAEKLTEKYKGMVNNQFVRTFGEREYWKIVTQNQTARISSYANIEDYELAGYDGYEWITREDGVCEICNMLGSAPYKYFRVSDARENIDKYYEAAAKNDVEKMKKADQFVDKKNPVRTGIMPQAHIKCFCAISPVMLSEVQNPEIYDFI